MTHRILTEFQYRCTSRAASEEVNLSSSWVDHDPTTAELVRTYRSIDLNGQGLLKVLEKVERAIRKGEDIVKIVPTDNKKASGKDIELRHFPDHYGYRGADPRVVYLSPWEFLMLWEVKPLPKPKMVTESHS